MDCYLTVEIGFFLSQEDLKKIIKTRRAKVSNHDYPEEMNYCPETGARLWKEEIYFDNPLLCYGEEIYFSDEEESPKYSVFPCNGDYENSDHARIVINTFAEEESEFSINDLEKIKEFIEEMKKDLEKEPWFQEPRLLIFNQWN